MLTALRDVRVRSDVRLTEVPAPTRIAPYAAALTADVIDPADPEDELATGRFVLLHDPAGPDTWAGTWRVVTFARAALEPELAGDPMLSAVGWSWLTDSLKGRALTWTAEAGTVTRVVSESFGGLADRAASVEMEIRASWTPVRGALTEHLRGVGRPTVHHRRDPAPAGRCGGRCPGNAGDGMLVSRLRGLRAAGRDRRGAALASLLTMPPPTDGVPPWSSTDERSPDALLPRPSRRAPAPSASMRSAPRATGRAVAPTSSRCAVSGSGHPVDPNRRPARPGAARRGDR